MAVGAFLGARALALPVWTAGAALLLWVLKDVLLFRAMQAVFRPPASPELVGSRAEAVEALTPTGYVRVHGELWLATTHDGAPIAAGTRVLVVAARGLTLVVEDAGATPPAPQA